MELELEFADGDDVGGDDGEAMQLKLWNIYMALVVVEKEPKPKPEPEPEHLPFTSPFAFSVW